MTLAREAGTVLQWFGNRSSPTGTLPTSYSTTTTALTIVNASSSNAEFVYHCRPY